MSHGFRWRLIGPTRRPNQENEMINTVCCCFLLLLLYSSSSSNGERRRRRKKRKEAEERQWTLSKPVELNEKKMVWVCK